MALPAIIGNLLKGDIGQTFQDIAGIWKVPAETVAANLQEQFKLEAGLESKAQEMFTRNLEAVNATMRAEAESEHWLQWSWRPICGLTLAGMVINNYILVPYFLAFGARPVDVPEIVWESLLAVVGVSALTRGAAQIAEMWKQTSAKNPSN